VPEAYAKDADHPGCIVIAVVVHETDEEIPETDDKGEEYRATEQDQLAVLQKLGAVFGARQILKLGQEWKPYFRTELIDNLPRNIRHGICHTIEA
jgi:hypothetical protein